MLSLSTDFDKEKKKFNLYKKGILYVFKLDKKPNFKIIKNLKEFL